ncbi:MAG TPA: exosortase A [Croceibacterium sp.]
MPPEATLAAATVGPASVPEAWRGPLVRLALAWAMLIALAWSDWAEMARQWWDSSTYNHILLIPPILFWLVRQRSFELARLTPAAWWPGFVWLAAGLLVWLGGGAAEINLIAQLGAVMLLQGAVAVLLGPRIVWGLWFPLAYMLFLVPFGDEIVPALQAITAKLAIALTHASGVPATIEGVFIDTPVGLFEVAEACSGVKFLVAMIALGTLVAHLCFASPKRRAAFMLAAAIVPVLANGVRAWGTIFIAQSQGIEFAAGFDHIVYGWIFFALVMAIMLGGSWRFFDRSPDDPLLDAAAVEASPRLARLATASIGGTQAATGILLLALAGGWMDRVALLP